MSRPSDGMTLDELRDEFDWMFEFQSRMAERIRDDEDVHNLVDYVTKLEAENAKLRELVRDWYQLAVGGADSLTDWNHAQADLEDRMRKLGVEVDG